MDNNYDTITNTIQSNSNWFYRRRSVLEESIKVEYYVNENKWKERLQTYFLRNQKSSLRILRVKMTIKLLACLLYVIRVFFDRGPDYISCATCDMTSNDNQTSVRVPKPSLHGVDWEAIIWVDRSFTLWLCQTTVACVCLAEGIMFAYLRFKGNLHRSMFSLQLMEEFMYNFPFIPTIFFPSLRHLFVPSFLNCWLAKRTLEVMFYDLNRIKQKQQSALSHRLTILSATVLCLVFTSACGIQHFQRGGGSQMNLFESLYFVVVTFSTVGYGDYKPDNMSSQIFVVVMICIALIVLPTQCEQLVYTFMERQKMGRNYRVNRANNERHVVVCSTTLHDKTVLDFLNEFYAHPLLQDIYTVLLSPSELDTTMNMILQVPMWSHRVIYIKGTVLNDDDLVRARLDTAEACFILAVRNCDDIEAADEHNILRSWAIRDFAPHVPQLVQIFRTKNKMHVAFAEQVVCEDEFKYAILANNCLCPGTSTLVSLLVHTSRGEEGQHSSEQWQRLYGRGSGNEIYHIKLRESRVFAEYEGKSFTYASFHAHRKYGVALIGVQTVTRSSWPILLNPGPSYILRAGDTCFYMSITEEQNSAFSKEIKKKVEVSRDAGSVESSRLGSDEGSYSRLSESSPELRFNMSEIMSDKNFVSEEELKVVSYKRKNYRPNCQIPWLAGTASKLSSIDRVPESVSEDDILRKLNAVKERSTWSIAEENTPIVKGYPPVLPYIGVTPTLCYLLERKKPACCLHLTKPCAHSDKRSAHEYKWANKSIILTADIAADGIYNFIIPLRAHFHSLDTLRPIVLLLRNAPHQAFIDVISWLPLVYWAEGSISSLDDLLYAGINMAESIVVINKESTNSMFSIYLADCSTIVDVQTVFKMFPNLRIMTELRQASNMRFTQFRAHDIYALSLSKVEKYEKNRGSHLSYMFRLPFAAGSVFSAAMLDTLLYQAFIKNYMITILRLLLGIDQAPGSGFLSSRPITKQDLWLVTYGRLYQKLCTTTYDIPIGIYRTQKCPTASCTSLNMDADEEFVTQYQQLSAEIEREEISNLVRNRMRDLDLPVHEYDKVIKVRDRLSYVIINPSRDLKLEDGDIVYIIRTSPMEHTEKCKSVDEDR